MDSRKIGNHFLRETVGKELVFRIGTEIAERQNNHAFGRTARSWLRRRQCGGEFFGRGEPLLRISIERLRQSIVKIGRQFGRNRSCARRGFSEPPCDGFRRSGKRRRTSQRLKEHTSQAIEVAARIECGVARRLLRTHVRRRTQNHACLRQRGVACKTHSARNSEIREKGVTVLQKNIPRFDVPVDDAFSMRERQRIRHPSGDAHRIFYRQTTLERQTIAQRSFLDVRHNVIQHSVGDARIVQRQNVRMREAGGEFDFTQESIAAHEGGELRVKDLDCHLAPMLHIIGQVDSRRPAAPQFANDPVAISKRRDERLQVLVHTGE